MSPYRPGSLLCHLAQLPDPRSRHGRHHDLVALLTVVCAAILCGMRSFAAIAQWAQLQDIRLLHRLGFRRHPPTAGAYQYLFRLLDPQAFEAALRGWIEPLIPASPEQLRVTPLDGKTLRGSPTALQPAVHLLSLLDQPTGCVLQQMAVAGKTNEHKAALQLLEGLLLEGRIITGDAMFCHRDVAQQILDSGGHYFLAVKDNQETLKNDIETAFEPAFSPS